MFPKFSGKADETGDPRVNSYWIENVTVCWLVLKIIVKHRFESSQGQNMREKCIEINALGSKMCLEALYMAALLSPFLQNVCSCWRRKCSVAADCNDCCIILSLQTSEHHCKFRLIVAVFSKLNIFLQQF